MIFASYFTPNGTYPALARRLMDSLDAFGLRHRVQQVRDGGDWRSSLMGKPAYIRHCLHEHRCSVVWLDADCTVKKFPSLLFTTAHDFAVYNWRADPSNPNSIPHDPSRLVCSGGVMMFGYTAPAMELLDRWEAEQAACPEIGDDPALDHVFNQSRPPVNPLWLPASYNRMGEKFAGVEPVIDHDYTAGAHRGDGTGPMKQ